MKKFSAILLTLWILISLSNVGASAAETKNANIKTVMNDLFVHLAALKKFIISEETFNDPKNELEITTHLQELEKAAKQTAHVPLLKQENFKFSQQVLKTQISEASRIFRLGNKPYARWMINSTISVCTSCHSQLPTKSRSYKEFENFKIYTSDFDRAEFLFATRRFEDAFKIYHDLIINFPKSTDRVDQLETSLERQVAYFSRIKRNADEAITELGGYSKNKKLPSYLLQNLSAWILQFKDWKRQGLVDPHTISEADLIKLAEKRLRPGTAVFEASNPKLVSYLWVSGILYEYLLTHDRSKTTPQILYWLSVCDRALSHTFFYSLANLYLRECITAFPADPFAKKCFKEYNEEIVLGYSGSSGTHLPSEVKTDLENLKKWIDSKGTVQLPQN